MTVANIIDQQSDQQVEAVAQTLFAALRAKFGPAACARVYVWPARIELVPQMQFPALVVYRETDREEPASDVAEDVRTITLRVDYYAPLCGLDRVELRWPLLHAVWTYVLTVMRVGWHPARVDTNDEPIELAMAGLETPAAVSGVARYQTAQTDAGIIPCLFGTLTVRASQFLDLSDYPSDDLEEIATNSTTQDGDEEPAFEQLVTDLDV